MKMKIGVFIFSFLLFAGVCIAEEITFSSLWPLAPSKKSITNIEYLFEGIKKRNDLKANFSDIKKTKQALYENLKSLTHFHDRLPCSLSAEPESIFKFSLHQLILVYLILDGLQNDDLSSQIGKIIDGYKEGNFYEPGGLGLIDNGKVMLKLVPSEKDEKKIAFDFAYILPFMDFARPHIFTFHMHPIDNSGPYPIPSWSVEIDIEEKEAKFGRDIGVALYRAKNHGNSHHILISKMYNRSFNIDYYVAEKVPEPPSYDSSDYCGKLAGFKIVDLGVWKY